MIPALVGVLSLGWKDIDRIFRASLKEEPEDEYLLVDGYNIIFAWDELKELSHTSLDTARHVLMNLLCNYQGYRGCTLILVFDAYKDPQGLGSKPLLSVFF